MLSKAERLTDAPLAAAGAATRRARAAPGRRRAAQLPSGADRHVAVIGAGVAGLATAIDLAAAGCRVTLLERAARPGGKMRSLSPSPTPGAAPIDAGPTVFTMRWVFEELFERAGARLSDHLDAAPAQVLARHFWADQGDPRPFDLLADPAAATAAVADYFNPGEAERYQAFAARARRIYEALEQPFIAGERAGPLALMRRLGARTTLELTRIAPLAPLWRALGGCFRDPRLRQLFARYATYCGSSPFAAPGVLMLVAHVEQAGVWRITGGMAQLAAALTNLAEGLGVRLRCTTEAAEITLFNGRADGVRLASGEWIAADAVVAAGDAAALAAGCFGAGAAAATRRVRRRDRSLSAVVWTAEADVRGFPLSHHTVLFPQDYRAEFQAIFKERRLPDDPTVYICAQDRAAGDGPAPTGRERLHILVNAPADGDLASAAKPGGPLHEAEIDRCETRMTALLKRCGMSLSLERSATIRTDPTGFEALFPATGGALYGPANHGPMGTFLRPGGRTRIPGLHLAGGSVHPGPGVPMAALSGRLAAMRILSDFGSEPRLRPAGISGGMSTG